MRRLSVLVLLLVTAPLAASAQTAAAAPEGPSQIETVIHLRAGGGLHATLFGEGRWVRLDLFGHRQYVEYTVAGKTSTTGVEARFGKLGEVVVEFTPTRTTEAVKPPPECRGEPWTTRAGFFTGTIRFRGEGGYVEIAAERAKGTVRAMPDWRCSSRPSGLPPRPDRGAAEVEREGDLATLVARGPGKPSRAFGAYAIRDPEEGNYTFFGASTQERQEGMKIVRSTGGAARASSFRFDHARGTATVSPPWPFSGRASFRRTTHGPDLWRGDLRVPLLGAGTVVLTGPGFTAALKRDFPSD